MAAAAVDVGYLAASYSVPDTTLHSLLSAPTVELVQSLLVQIEAKARAYDDLESDKTRAEVELEAAERNGEQRAQKLQAAADKAQKEANELQQKLDREEIRREQAEADLANLKASATGSTSEVQALESRVKTLESQNRDALAMHEAKVAAHDRLAKELSEQHQKSVDLRKQVSVLEEKNQTLESAASNVKFRETNLQQEIEALRKNNDWYTTELKTRSDEHSKYRKEKNAQVATLQRENADASETIDSLRRTETLLRQHIEELKGKAEEDRLRIEELENKASKDEADFRIELDNVRRLAKLHQTSAETAKQRLVELQTELERSKDDAAEEIGLLQADVELERNKAAQAEGQVAELETLVESLQSEASELRHSVRMPATPRRGINGVLGTPVRAGSPAVFSPGGSQLKADATRTQLLIENNDLKKDVRRLREKGEEQTNMINEMIEELERRQPEFDELRRESDALNDQITNLSNLLDDAIAERESARREQRKAAGELEGTQNELQELKHQVQDMTIQLRSLLWRREAEENGLDSLPPEQKQFVLDSVNNEVPAEHLTSNSESHNHVTRLLLLYTNVKELQQQNMEQLTTLRNLADSHEAQLARSQTAQHEQDQKELSALKSLIAEKDDQIQTISTRSQTWKAERDMYCRLVSNKGHLSSSQGNPAFAQSVPVGGHPLQLEQAPSQNSPEYSKLIKDLQSHIDLLKEESATDRATSKSQVDGLTKENNELQTEKIRLESQVRREQDRYTRLEGTIKLLQSEKDTLQERYNNIQATLAKQDDRIVKSDQDVAEATTRIQGLESEIVHLKASQQVSKTIEERLKERNAELMEERDRLSKHVSEIQSLRNEQELATANNRRELQSRVGKLEADLQNTQQKLEAELADHKRTTQQRDYERSEAQRRIDDLITARNNAEVKSASADSVRQQLEQRINDLQTQLKSAEERVQSLQPQRTSRANGSTHEEEDSSNSEEELTSQLADLQRKLERKQEDLDAVNVQLEQFQGIAQDAEERLQAFIEAHERLQEELNLAQQEKDATIAELQQRVEDISSELATSTTELTEVRGQHEQETLQLNQAKETLEIEISRLKNDVNDYKEEATAQSELVKTQADIAARAQQDYEHELDKHGETMKNLRALRDEHSQLKADIAQFNAQAESARTTLEQSQEHWQSAQSQYEDQLTEAKRRHDDLKQYNETLLKQFDEYKAQIDGLKHDRGTLPAGDAGTVAPGSNNLQDIETYLRREKEILEVQLNLKEQEAKRLEQQLTHAQSQLDQTREKLIAEQSKTQGSQSGASLQSLQDRVQELNVYRESNMTLRNDNGRLLTKLAEQTKALEDIRGELEPLRIRVSDLEGELELNVGHLKAVEEDRDRWQKRHQDVLQRYDRIDPKELEDLKTRIEDLTVERDQALEQVTSLNDKIKSVEAAQETIIAQTREATVQEVRATETDKARKGFNKVHHEKMQAKKVEIDALAAERDELQNQLTAVQQEHRQTQEQLTAAHAQANQAQEQVNALEQQLAHAQTELVHAQQELQAAKATQAASGSTDAPAADVSMSDEGQIDESGSSASNEQIEKLKQQLGEAQNRFQDAQGRANAADNKAAGLAVQFSMAQGQVTSLDKEVAEKGNRILELQTELAAAKLQSTQQEPAQAPIDASTTPVAPEDMQQLKDEIAAARKEIENLKSQLAEAQASSQAKENAPPAVTQDDDQIATMKAALDQREADLEKLKTELQGREDRVSKREKGAADFKNKANEKIIELRDRKNAEIESLRKTHQAELARLQTETQTNGSGSSSSVKEETQAPNATSTPLQEGMVNTEDLPRPVASTVQVTNWFKTNPEAKEIMVQQVRENLKKATAQQSEQIARLRKELAELQAHKSADDAGPGKEDPEQGKREQDLQEQLKEIKAEHEQALKEAVAKKEASVTKLGSLKLTIKENQIAGWKAKWAVIEKAAMETPTEEVAKVYEIANNAGKPTAQPNTPVKQVQAPNATSHPQASNSAQSSAAPPSAQQQTAAPTSGNSQPNGTSIGVAGQVAQAAPSQQSNPFLQAGHGNAPNPFTQGQSQLGRGLQQPGFTGQGQGQTTSNPQLQQQHPAGRGASAAIRGAIQSNIPRGGGSSIPLPGGRGRGQANSNQPQASNVGAQGSGTSQIGRGGGQGRGRGRGQSGAQGQGSPARGGMNPGAQNFSPGGGRGQGQKRGAEDEGDGGQRGGKRPRGRGGQGGGGGGAAPNAGAE